jgi:hypothetical protein
VLLPTVEPDPQQETPLARTATNLLLQGLQAELGTAIRVLKVDETSYPAVMRAFDGRGAPVFVLLRELASAPGPAAVAAPNAPAGK